MDYPITITWGVIYIDIIPRVNGVNNYIKGIVFSCNGNDGAYSFRATGYISYDVVAPTASFLPYENLTKEIAIEWVKNSIGDAGINALENLVKNTINEINVNQTVIKNVPIWATGDL